MRILFAAPDRDLLECYKAILEYDFGETVTAFDGTQVISILSNEDFDAAVIDSDIPRVEYTKLIAKIRRKNIPVMLLTDRPLSASFAGDGLLPDACLSHPFTPAQIEDGLRDLMNKERTFAI